jgi:hypothetical protein
MAPALAIAHGVLEPAPHPVLRRAHSSLDRRPPESGSRLQVVDQVRTR